LKAFIVYYGRYCFLKIQDTISLYNSPLLIARLKQPRLAIIITEDGEFQPADVEAKDKSR